MGSESEQLSNELSGGGDGPLSSQSRGSGIEIASRPVAARRIRHEIRARHGTASTSRAPTDMQGNIVFGSQLEDDEEGQGTAAT